MHRLSRLLFSALIAIVVLVAMPRTTNAQAQFRVIAPSVHLISAMGSKCLGVEGGRMQPGTRVILWDCLEQPDQLFQFLPNGQISLFAGSSLCLDDFGGKYQEMDQISAYPCAQSSSRWRFSQGQILSPNGMCLDLRGGTQRWYLGNQDAILYRCNGQPNQSFVAGMTVRRGSAAQVMNPGVLSGMSPRSGSPVLALTPNGLVATGGGNLVAAGGGNLVAAGGGNLVAAGGGNLVAQGGGNIVAQGGGNVIVPVGNTF